MVTGQIWLWLYLVNDVTTIPTPSLIHQMTARETIIQQAILSGSVMLCLLSFSFLRVSRVRHHDWHWTYKGHLFGFFIFLIRDLSNVCVPELWDESCPHQHETSCFAKGLALWGLSIFTRLWEHKNFSLQHVQFRLIKKHYEIQNDPQCFVEIGQKPTWVETFVYFLFQQSFINFFHKKKGTKVQDYKVTEWGRRHIRKPK